ncbi:MAG: class II fructose-bisphosphatase [Deltaproteobacteria bacterium]|nr:class II fructose-bisphosphatase [Deltaproteobacteria bacterium]
MDRNLAMDAVRVTEAAALASARTMGLGDLHRAEEAAVQAMRQAFDSLDISGTVVIGEGSEAEVPVIYVGERVGRGRETDPEVELAADPLEGSRLCARGMPNAMSVIAMVRNGHFLRVPDTYMYKIAVGPAGKGAIDLNRPIRWNLNSVADAKGVYPEDLTVVVLDRPRHEGLIREIRETGARIKLIPDGDVAAAIATCRDETGIDMLLGEGGAPEGIIAAAALRCVGGDMLGQLRPRSAVETEQIKALGVDVVDQIFTMDDMAQGDVLFAATGITDGDLLRGVRFRRGGAVTNSMVMRSKTMTVRLIEAQHRFDRKPNYGDL